LELKLLCKTAKIAKKTRQLQLQNLYWSIFQGETAIGAFSKVMKPPLEHFSM
jgi:hypothetical protein